MFDSGNKPETRTVQDGTHMLRKMIHIPEDVAHYVVGSVYLMAHLVTYQRRMGY